MPPRLSHPGPLLLRLMVYAGLQYGLLYLHLRLTSDGSAEAAKAYLTEGGWLESLQLAVLIATLALLLAGRGRGRTIHVLLACAVAAALARELDTSFTEWLWKRSHRVPMVALALLAAGIVFHRCAALGSELASFLTRPGFWLMFLGMSLAVVYAVILGQNAMWIERSARGFDRINKRFVEEGLEASGYVWIFFGVLEETWHTRRRRTA